MNNTHQHTEVTPPLPREGNGGGASIEHKIEFDEIRTLLRGHCISHLGTERVDELTFLTDANDIRFRLALVSEVGQLIDTELQLPGEDFFDLRLPVRRIRVEGVNLEEQEMWELKRSLDTLHSWLAVIQADQSPYPNLLRLSNGVFTFHSVTRRIEEILDKYGHVRDTASPELQRIRRELHRTEGSVSRTLNSILESAKREGLIEQTTMPTIRDGRLVIPVAPALKRRIRGIVHGESASGKTIFVEPSAVVEANNTLRELEADERREIKRILQAFTEELRPNIPELLRAYEFLADLELALAKHRLAQQMGAVVPEVHNRPLIDWTLARHPLLDLRLRRQGRKAVPLDIALNTSARILIISGPNAGGKSVCLKTVGLLQYMLQCGLPIPVGERSQVGIFSEILIDIGDEQSLSDDLSTYSSHLLNMKLMMRRANERTLLLIDEFGSGTEPTIGGALAEAMLERFARQGTYAVITTHYQNLKQFADSHTGIVNGSMLYDRQQMQALFQLEIGHPGSSFAVEIARKTGIPEDVIARATELVGQDYINADKYLLDIVRDKRYWEGKRQNIREREKDMEKTLARYEQEMAQLQQRRREIIDTARQQAHDILDQSNAMVENTIRKIREAQAEKERTREVRSELDAFRTTIDQTARADDEAIDRKMQQIIARQQRQAERKRQKQEKKNQPTQAEAPAAPKPATLAEGQLVRIKGQTTTGTIEQMRGRKATVLFGQVRTTLPLDMLQPAEGTEPKPKTDHQQRSWTGTISRQTLDHMHQTQLSFRPEIDVRGQRADEALQIVTRFLDDALLVGAPRLRILHGTGTGALRQLIRQYLQTVPSVRHFRDEHVQFGGAGITVVEME